METNLEKQLRYDKAYLKMAFEWANLSYCERKKVGAIIVKGKMMDVGVDNIFKLKGEYRPINLTEIEEIMSKKDSYLPDHHQKNTN